MDNLIYRPAPGEEEIWINCEDYPAYDVSTFGQVRNTLTNHMMTLKYSNSGGYAQVHLRVGIDSPNGKYVAVHRLVAQAFCHNNDPEKRIEVDHRDRDRTNNYYKNLKWVSHKENLENQTSHRKERVYKKSTPIVLLDRETKELLAEYSSPNEAGQVLKLSPQVIVDNIHHHSQFMKVGLFMTKKNYENNFLTQAKN